MQLADFAGGAFALGCVDEEAFGGVDNFFKLAGGDGALFAGAEEAAQNFFPVEALAAAIFFDDHVGDFVDAFVGGEAAITFFALATAADGVGFFAFTRVDDTVLRKPAVGTLHSVAIVRGRGSNSEQCAVISGHGSGGRWSA